MYNIVYIIIFELKQFYMINLIFVKYIKKFKYLCLCFNEK